MEGKHALVVDTINKLLASSNAKQKVQHIEELEELLLRNEPALLDDFLPELMPLQMDKAVSVRRKLLEFVAASVRVRPSPPVISTAAPCVTTLLSDEQAQLAREAAQSAHQLLDRGLLMLASLPQGHPAAAAAAAAWSAVQFLQSALTNMAASLASSHGGTSSRQLAMCLAGIKLTEQAVLQYTCDAATRLPVAQALAAEAQRLVGVLSGLVAVEGVKQRAGPVVIGAMKALGLCCLQRPQLAPVLLPPLLALAQQGVYSVPKPGDGQSGIDASCGSALKDVLVRVYRSNSEPTKPWQQRLRQALETMGAEAAAASAQRHLDRAAARAAGHKRKATDQPSREAKQQASNTSTAAGGADSSVNNTPARTPTPQPMQGNGDGGGGGGGVDMPPDLMQLFRPGPGVNLAEALDNAQQVLEVLVKADQIQAVEAILEKVAPGVMGELVARWLDNLPPDNPWAPKPAAAAAGKQGPPGALPMQFDAAGLSQFLEQATQQQRPAPPAPPAQQQAAATDPRHKARAAAAAAAAATAAAAAAAAQPPPQPSAAAPPPAVVVRPAGPQLPSPLPRLLKPDQVQVMRTAAVQRILAASDNKPIRHFRELLLSRLASRAPQGAGLTDLMLTHVLGNYHKDRGHVLLVRWLYALAAATATDSWAQQRDQQQQQQQQQQPGPADTAEGAAAAGSDTDMPDAAAAAGAGAEGGAAAAAAAGAEGGAAAAAAAAAAAGAEGGAAAAAAAGQQTPADAGDAAMDDDTSPATAAAAEAGHSSKQQRGPQPMDTAAPTSHQQQQDQDESLRHSQAAGSTPLATSSSSSTSGDLSGTPYEAVLISSLKGLKESLPSTDPAIPRLLQEAPVLPLPAVTAFLQELLCEGPEWARVGLSTAYSLFESRPAARSLLLQLLLDAAVGPDSSSREKAVGLVVSKVMTWESHAAVVQDFATQHLLMLTRPVPAAAAADDGDQKQQQQQAKGDAQQQAGAAEAGEQPASPSKQEAAEPEGGEAGGQQQQQEQQEEQQEEQLVMDVGAAAQHSMLYLSLCTRKPELLRLLLETYGEAGPDARTALSRYAPSLALALAPTNAALLALIRQPPEQSTDLLLDMITALSDSQSPPEELVQACAAHYASTGSVQLMDPIVRALSKDSVVQLLPKLLMQLPDQRLRLLYRRLALPQHGKEPIFAPVELLVLLHKVTSDPSVFKTQTRQVISAVDRAMRTPEVFPAAVMQMAISRMEAMNPPPRLFMRSVTIMVTNAAAPLLKWVITLLERLIQKQVWENGTQWKGFLVCCEKLAEHGSPLVLLQLPESILERALDSLPRSLWKKVHDAVHAPNCPVVVYKGVRQVVDKFHEKWMRAEIEHKQAELAARQAAAAAAGGSSGSGAGSGGAAGSGGKTGRVSLGGGGAGAQQGAKTKGRPSSAAAATAAAAKAPSEAAAAAAATGSVDAVGSKPTGSTAEQQAAADAAGTQAAAAAAAEAAAGQQAQQPPGAPTHDAGDDDDGDFVLDFEDDDE